MSKKTIIPTPSYPPKLKSHIPDLIEQKGWTKGEFFGRVRIAGRSEEVAKRAMDGNTDFNVFTLALFKQLFGVDTMDEIIEVISRN